MSTAAGTSAATVRRSTLSLARLRNPYWARLHKEHQAKKQYYRDIARARGATDFRGKPIFTPYTWNIRPGDLVEVTQPSLVKDYPSKKPLMNQFGQRMTHKYLGQQGKVLALLRKQERIIVEGVNLKTRHVRPSESERSYQFLEESPIPYQWVRLVDPSTGRPHTGRISLVPNSTGSVDRLLKASKTRLPFSKRDETNAKIKIANIRTDTKPEDVLEVTYVKPDYTVQPKVARDENGNVIYFDEEVPLTQAELKALAARRRLTKVQQKQLETGVRIQKSTLFEADEDIELRAARIKF